MGLNPETRILTGLDPKLSFVEMVLDKFSNEIEQFGLKNKEIGFGFVNFKD